MIALLGLLLAGGAPRVVPPPPPAPARARLPDEPCLIIKDTPEIAPAEFLPRVADLVGPYRCRFAEPGVRLGIDVDLRADSSFTAALSGFDESAEVEEGDPLVRASNYSGSWRLDGSYVSLIDQSVPQVARVQPVGFDRKVAYAITVVTPHGKPVSSLVAYEPDSSTVVAFEGEVDRDTSYPPPYMVWLARQGDAGGGFVAAVEIRKGQANTFRVIYDEHKPHPKNLRLQVAGPRNQVLVLPAGLGAMVLRRVR